MNYIATLQAQVREAQAREAARADRFAELRRHLELPKFAAVQADGTRGDWISTADVQRWMRYLEHGDHT